MFETDDPEAWKREDRVFASLENDAEGFAQITALSARPPDSGPYLQTDVQYVYAERREVRDRDDPAAGTLTGEWRVTLKMPFDRFYMEEKLAPEAERAYRDHSRP